MPQLFVQGFIKPHLKNEGEGEEKEKAILRIVSYHRRDYDLCVVRTSPHVIRLARDSLRRPFRRASRTSGLGILARLPIEVLSLICLRLNVRTLFRFRQVSRRAREVSNTPEYQIVAEHGLQALHGLLLTRLASHYTIIDLYGALLVRDCTICGSFGGLLFLPTVKRCCFECIRNSPNLRIISLSGLSKAKDIPSDVLSELIPILCTTCGIYSLNEISITQSVDCVSELQAINILRDLGLWHSEINRVRIPTLTVWRYMAATALPYLDVETGLVERGVSCKGCHARVENAPYMDLDERDKVYSNAGLLEHFKECAAAREVYERSQGGTVWIDGSGFTSRGGYLGDYDIDGMPR